MSDASAPRRQPPSPLIFSPETVLAPIATNNVLKHGSGQNTVSMPFIKRHVTRRLKTAKQECDKDLQRVTDAITAFFEERLREGEVDQSDAEGSRETIPHSFGDHRSSFQADDASSDGGYDAEFEGSRHSRQRGSPTQIPGDGLAHSYSSSRLRAESISSSPASLRRQSTLPKERASLSASTSSLSPNDGGSRKNSSAGASWNSQGRASRRLSRTIHIPPRASRSGQSSRSTSRSRSPLPGANHNGFSDHAISTSPNRRSSRILVDDPVDPIMTSLYELVGVATDIKETTISQLTAQPKLVSQLVHRVQEIGKAWDDHPEWHGRNWYVQVLLAVASLSRVVEWWEAEKQFWNFADDDDDDEKAEPFTFLLKPVEGAAPTPTVSQIPETDSAEQTSIVPDDENRLCLSRHPSGPGHARETAQKATPSKAGESPAKHMNVAESARVLATERLRLQAEQAQNQNIVLELSLDGEHFVWANYAWAVVVGSDPMEMIGTRITNLLAPTDVDVFRKATDQLLSDDSHTLEVRFRLQIQPAEDAASNRGILYREMEGKGMLMLDQADGQPSHTMWVIKPVGPPVYDQSQTIMPGTGAILEEPQITESPGELTVPAHEEAGAPFPLPRPISTAVILCRICENNIPEWFFEKHNETCNDVHKFEADIGECNESIIELRNTIREIRNRVEQTSDLTPEYRGIPILSPPSGGVTFGRKTFKNFVQRNSFKRMQKRLLEQLDEILLNALEISIPSLREEESKEPIERQRLLSPTSDAKVQRIKTWTKPSSDDPALAQLISDVDTLMKAKIDNVVRMQNTIRYSEKVRQEWQEKIEQELALNEEEELEAEDDEEEEVDGAQDEAAGEDDKASTTSEYAFSGDGQVSEPTPIPSSDPTPIASVSPAGSASSSTPSSRSTSIRAPVPSMPIPGVHQGPGVNLYTRSSTPSSITSPLALAAPIVASSDTDNSSASSSPKDSQDKTKTIVHRKSQQALEPKFTVTPPVSPHIMPRDSTCGGPPRIRRLSTITNLMSPGGSGPLSPRIPSAVPSKTTTTSIKDFEVIKPISKGAFGSVFLAKKRTTGDYYAIKVLKKADMIAKNQITNVKAERMILMNQAESPFVAKLYFTFQSKDNLYLVMEYLNGGDCAALIKSLGCLPEEWTRQYIAEVVLGLEYLHNRGIVHRDLKPDNLLIDQHGHLKLTDFGLSRIGLLGRQTRDVNLRAELARAQTKHSPGSRPPSMDAVYLSSPLLSAADTPGGSYFLQRSPSISAPPLASSPHISTGTPTDEVSESSGSDSMSSFFLRRAGKLHAPGNNNGGSGTVKQNESPLQSFATELTNDLRSYANNPSGSGTPPGEQKFVGTPDYLAPESILGISGDDAAVDWWALGVITYEFIYGIPPFHAETPEKVFENILSGHIDWHEGYIDFSEEALDFMKKLLTVDTSKRLGASGAEEVKAHPWFKGIEWDKVTKSEAAFIPQISDPESTDYFDLRGATQQLFHDDEAIPVGQSAATPGIPSFPSSSVSPIPIASRESSSPSSDDFGSFSFKNLPVLKQANDDVIRKMKTDQMVPLVHTLSEPAHIGKPHRRSISQRIKKPPSVVTTGDGITPGTNPPSPATSVSSIASSPSRGSMQPSTPGSVITGGTTSHNHSRKPSEYVERFRQSLYEGETARRNSAPSRLRTASVSTSGEGSMSDHWPNYVPHVTGHPDSGTPPQSTSSWDLKRTTDPNDRAVTCLLAEDNPITAKIIETLLIRLGCRVIVVADGSEAISVAHSDIKFDCILMDLHMPVVDGESAARHIKSTNNKNSSVPIIAVSAYGMADNSASNLFAASLSKPVQKPDLLAVMRQLGFKTSTQQDGGAPSTRVVTTR